AVEGTDAQVQLLNGHLQRLLTALVVVIDHDVGLARFVAEVDKQVQMLGQHTGRQAQGFLRVAGAVGPDLDNELVIVGDLAYTGVIHRVVGFEHRGVDAVDRQGAGVVFLHQREFVALCGDVTTALVEGDLHDQLGALAQGGDMPFRVEDLQVIAALDGTGDELAGAGRLDPDGLGAVAIDLGGNTLEVQDDLRHVLPYALDGGKLMHHAVDLDAGD